MLQFGASLLLALLTFSGEASGRFKADKHPAIAPRFASAYETRDPADARRRAIEVVLGAVEDLDPHTHVINQDALKGTNYMLLWIRPDGGVSVNATDSGTMTQFVDNASFGKMTVDLTKNTADEVAGRIAITREGYCQRPLNFDPLAAIRFDPSIAAISRIIPITPKTTPVRISLARKRAVLKAAIPYPTSTVRDVSA